MGEASLLSFSVSISSVQDMKEERDPDTHLLSALTPTHLSVLGAGDTDVDITFKLTNIYLLNTCYVQGTLHSFSSDAALQGGLRFPFLLPRRGVRREDGG